jgi:hypothetical protein
MKNASKNKLVIYGKIAEARLTESIPMLYEILIKEKSTMDDEQGRMQVVCIGVS